MKPLLRLIFPSILVLFLAAAQSSAQAPLKIHVSILPQKYFVERITKDLASVDVLVKPGKSPATYSPTPAQVKALSGADVYFRIGVPFENGFLHKIESIARDIKVVDCRKGIALREMEAHSHEEDHHDEGHHEGEHHHAEDHHEGEHHEGEHPAEEGHKDDHDHTGKDPHIWMSPLLVKQQAATILETLVALDPAHAGQYKTNFKEFVKDLDDLHHRLSDILKPFKGENLFVFHPAFGYFADAYGMHQIAVETMGKAPKGKELAAIIKLAKKEKTRVIFVQPQFDRNAAQKIASAIKGHVVAMDPLAHDYLANMEAMANTVAQKLKQ